MKRFNILKGLLFVLLVAVSIVLNIIEEIIKFIFSMIAKVKLNYQLMMFIYQFGR